jgi:hypothetical protein
MRSPRNQGLPLSGRGLIGVLAIVLSSSEASGSEQQREYKQRDGRN